MPDRSRPRPRSAPARRDGDTPVARALLAALSGCALLRAGAMLTDAPGLWGVGTLRDVPAPWGVVLAVLPFAALLPPVARAVGMMVRTLGRVLSAPPPFAYAGVSLVGFAALLGLRDALHFVGDADLRMTAITVRATSSTVFPQASPFDVAINLHFCRFLADTLGLAREDALQVVGALVGAVWAAGVLAFARSLSPSPTTRGLAFVAALATAIPLHFAGYDKYGPLLAALAWTAAGVVTVLRGGRPWMLVVAFTCAALAHRSALPLLPAVLATLVVALRDPARRREASLALALLLVGLALSAPSAWRGLTQVDARRHSALVARPLDALELLFFLVPLWPAGLIALGTTRPRASATTIVTALTLAPALAQLLLVRGSQGAFRDWDMHAGAASVIAFATALALAVRLDAPPATKAAARPWRAAALAVLVAIAAAIGAWATHVRTDTAMARVNRELRERTAWTDEAYARAQDFLGIHATRRGDARGAVEHWKAAAAAAPNPRYLYQVGLTLARSGHVDEGRGWILRAHALAPSNPDPFVGLAIIAADADSLEAADALLDSALARQPNKWDAVQMKQRIAAARR